MYLFQFQFTSKKEEEEIIKYGRCETCFFFKAKNGLCTKYNMITEDYKTCKGHIESNQVITTGRHR